MTPMTSLQVLLALLCVAILPASCSQASPACVKDSECGWNSFCGRGQCACIPNHVWSANQRDCVDVRCHESRCLDCSDDPRKCRRCTDFIEDGTGACLDRCPGSYILVIEGARLGKVCPVAVRPSMMRVYVAISIGVGVGIIMTSLTALGFYWHTRDGKSKKFKPKAPTRNEIESVQASHTNKAFDNIYTANGDRPTNRNMPNGHIKNGRIPNGHIANGHIANAHIAKHAKQTKASTRDGYSFQCIPNGQHTKRPRLTPPTPPEMNAFWKLVSDLRIYIDTFLAMLREIKSRNTALPEGDSRAYVYKNVIHQLCRVLTILNTDDEYLEAPPDGIPLLQWAEATLQKYLAIKDPEYWEPGSPVDTLTSTFKPDHRLIPNGQAPGAATNTSFKYERYSSDDMGNEEPQYLSIELENDFTAPIEV